MKPLNHREKIVITLGAAALAVFVVVQFLVFPMVDGRNRLAKRVASHEKALAEMRLWADKYQQLHQHSGSLASRLTERPPDFSLFSFLEQRAADSEVKELIASMKPSESMESGLGKTSQVEMKIQGISLDKLVHFLERVEAPEQLVGVNKITIQENGKEGGLLDVTLQMVGIDHVSDAVTPR